MSIPSDSSVPVDLLTPAQVAEMLKVSAASVRCWIHHGKLPAIRVGGRLRIHRADVEAMLTPVETVLVERPESKREIAARKAETDRVLKEWGVIK